MNSEEVLRKTCMAYEAKLKELMGEAAFKSFAEGVAKDLIMEDIQGIQDDKFREFCLDNFDKITGTSDDFSQLLGEFDPADDLGDLGDEDY